MANVAVGQEAPDFTLRNENNQEVKLSSLRGKPVVLFFFPLAFSPGKRYGASTTRLPSIFL